MMNQVLVRWGAPLITGVLALSLSACGAAPSAAGHPAAHHNTPTAASVPVPVYQEYTYGPWGQTHTVSKTIKNELQRLINGLGNPPANTISVKGINAYYQKNGTLVVTAFVRNGEDFPVSDISGRIRIEEHGQIIAAAEFTMSQEQFGILDPGVSEVWNFYYAPSTVYNHTANLQRYHVQSDLSWTKDY